MRGVALAGILVACSGGDGGDTGGAFHLSWDVTTDGQPVDCETAGIETLLVVTDDGTVLTTEQFLCTDGEATTGPRTPGEYTIDVTALDGADAAVATASDQGTAIVGRTIDLGVFVLETNP